MEVLAFCGTDPSRKKCSRNSDRCELERGRHLPRGRVPATTHPGTPLEIRERSEIEAASYRFQQVGLLAFRHDDHRRGTRLSRGGSFSRRTGICRSPLPGSSRFCAGWMSRAVLKIVAEPVPEVGLGRAIMERLRRAAAGSGPINRL